MDSLICPLAILWGGQDDAVTYILYLRTEAWDVKCLARGLRARKQRTYEPPGFLAVHLFLLGTLPLLTEPSRKLPAPGQWVVADRRIWSEWSLIGSSWRSVALGFCGLWCPVSQPLCQCTDSKKQVGSFELQALHCLDKIHSSLSCSLIQRSICCLMLAFVSALFLEAPGFQGWSALQSPAPGWALAVRGRHFVCIL